MEQDWLKQVKNRIEHVPTKSGRSSKWGKISFDNLTFVPAQLAKRPIDYYQENIKSNTIIGKLSSRPIKIEIPVVMGAMSFGALSREAKTALAKASTLANTLENSGEGGVLPEERQFAQHLIIQYSTGRFGLNEEILQQADAIEIKIGQGAKPGSGGFLPKEKITEEIAQIRKIPMNESIHSPAYHKDIKNVQDLKKKISWLRKLTKGVPIIIKLGAGDIEKDIKIAIQAKPDIIAIDGMEGGTGASPEVLSNELGIPTLAALVKARATLNKLKAPQELWIGGGFYKGGDVAKALALGADVVFMGSALLGAMGCLGCGLCYSGQCPKGIATQDNRLRQNLNIEEAAKYIANFLKNCTEEVKMIAGACGKNNIYHLDKNDLRSLDETISKITKVPLV